jgi:hypothetical protein
MSIWLTYYSLPSFMAAIIVFVYFVDKDYKKELTKNNKGYNLFKGGLYDKKRIIRDSFLSNYGMDKRVF